MSQNPILIVLVVGFADRPQLAGIRDNDLVPALAEQATDPGRVTTRFHDQGGTTVVFTERDQALMVVQNGAPF